MASRRHWWGADYFPNVELRTQHGTEVRLYDDLLKGKAVAINTFFAGCGDVCPLGTAKMLELQKLLGERVGKDIFFLSLSVDPENDTPEALKAYADRFNIGPGWLFLTGKAEDLRLVTRKLGLGIMQSTSPRDYHSTTLMVGRESTGQWIKNSVTDNPRWVASTIQTFLGWEERIARQLLASYKGMRMPNLGLAHDETAQILGTSSSGPRRCAPLPPTAMTTSTWRTSRAEAYRL